MSVPRLAAIEATDAPTKTTGSDVVTATVTGTTPQNAPVAVQADVQTTAVAEDKVRSVGKPTIEQSFAVDHIAENTLLVQDDGSVATIQDAQADTALPPTPDDAQCEPDDIRISQRYGTYPHYGYLATQCLAYTQYRTSGSGDFVAWLPNHGYPSPAASCSYARVIRIPAPFLGAPCDCEGLDDEGTDKPVKRRLGEPDSRRCDARCDDTIGIERTGDGPLVSQYKVWYDVDPSVSDVFTCAGLHGGDWKGHGQCAALFRLGCWPLSDFDSHIRIEKYSGPVPK